MCSGLLGRTHFCANTKDYAASSAPYRTRCSYCRIGHWLGRGIRIRLSAQLLAKSAKGKQQNCASIQGRRWCILHTASVSSPWYSACALSLSALHSCESSAEPSMLIILLTWSAQLPAYTWLPKCHSLSHCLYHTPVAYSCSRCLLKPTLVEHRTS